MKSFLRTALLLGVAVFVFKGCIFTTDPGDPIINVGEYLEPTSPENLINNLEQSYLRREIEEYAKLLAPAYIFKVQPVDVLEFGEFFTRDRDSTGTEALFSSLLVSEIRIDLIHGPADTTNQLDFPPGTLFIRIQPTSLEVDETTGITWQVDGDIQDLFFRKGNPDDGENPDHWLIIEWHDIPGGGAAPRIQNDPIDPSEAQVHHTSWGAMRGQWSEGSS